MPKYRKQLPQLGEQLFLTDGGLETTLIFHEKLDLPCFASFDLLKNQAGTETLRRYFERYITLAKAHGAGFLLESPTWRANPDWAAKLNYDAAALADANRRAIGLMLELRHAHQTDDCPMPISGNLGPRGDGYVVDRHMTAEEARDYHAAQVQTFAGTDADFVSAFTMNYAEEAIGIVQAARAAKMPVVIAFTVETDGRLPSGDSLAEAIRRTDQATDGYATYFMVNCAHPSHFEGALSNGDWRLRIRGVRANASRRSHAELDQAADLDDGNPPEFGSEHRDLLSLLPNLSVLGGCCGTDHRHVDALGHSCLRIAAAA